MARKANQALVGAFVLGYLLQYLGHCVEGNDLGEWAGIKRLVGLPYVGISPRADLSVREPINPPSPDARG